MTFRISWLLSVAFALVACKKSQDPPSADETVSGSTSAPGLDQPAEPAAAAVPSEPVRPKTPHNVLLLTIDSLRADMPWTGYSRPIAPNLTRLAEKSVVYTNAYSMSSYTAKSVATLLSGRYPSTLYRDGFFFTKYYASNLMFPEVLSERGIRTMGWHGHMYFGRGKGLDQGFDEWELVPGLSFDAQTDNHITSPKMTALGMELLGQEKNTSGQFFAWAHYMDPHDKYVKHKEAPDFGNRGRDRYDSEVWFTDLWVGKLLEWAEQQPWWKNTVLIISADHGEAFGEKNMYKHAFELWEVLTRVPLLVHGPGMVPRHIAERRSHIDITPTILELMQVPAMDGLHGRSLASELYGAPPDIREPIMLELSEDSHNPPRRALILGDYKLIQFSRWRFELYDLKNDPGEAKNLVTEQKEVFERMRKAMEDKWAALPTVAPHGGMSLKEGGTARGPMGPPKTDAPPKRITTDRPGQ